MPRVIFVNRFYWPDEPATAQLLTDLATSLANDSSREISVITSRPFGSRVPTREWNRGVDIIRVGSSRWGKRHPVGRILDFCGFIAGATWQLLLNSKKGDTVIIMTDPPMLGALVWPLLAVRRVKFMHWVQDIYPEIAIELTGHRWLKILIPFRNLAWRKAARCITLGQDMARVIKNGRVLDSKVGVIPNWAPAGTADPPASEVDALRRTWGLAGKFVVLYSGNLGRVHDLDPIIEIAAQLQTEPDITFVFVGDGAQSESLQSLVRTRNLANVRFFPPQPRQELAATLALGDVHFVTLRNGCQNYVFPSKFHGIVTAGRPLIFIGPQVSELAHLVNEHKLGYSFSRGQIPEIAAVIIRLKQDPTAMNGITAAVSRYTAVYGFDQAMKAWTHILDWKPVLAPAGESGACSKEINGHNS